MLVLGSSYGFLVLTSVLERCLGIVLCKRNKIVFGIYCWKANVAALRTIVCPKNSELMNWQSRFVCLSSIFLLSFFLCLSILFVFSLSIDIWEDKRCLHWSVSPSPLTELCISLSPLTEHCIRLFTCYPGLCWTPWSLSNRLWLWIIPARLMFCKTDILLLK